MTNYKNVQRPGSAPMLGDIVRPKPCRSPLRSGAEQYEDAVVVRVEPFALVTKSADMLWFCTVKREDFEPFGYADDETFERCRVRFPGGIENRRTKRERANVRRRNRRADLVA